MAIPGLKAKYEVRAKVRIGEKRTASSGKSYPAATDYFVSDDPEFIDLIPDRSQRLRIILPHDEVTDVFNTGLEWWTRSKTATKSTLACYTKGDGTAYRKDQMLDDDDVVVGPKMGQDRLPIVCRFRECPQFGHNCKPMGRLIFFLSGGATDRVLEIDTKSWNSIERLTAALTGARMKGSLLGRLFELTVAFETKGANRFPVMSIEEVEVQVNNESDINRAEGYIAIERAKDEGKSEREQLAAYLDQVRPDWRNDDTVIQRIINVGVPAALAAVRESANNNG